MQKNTEAPACSSSSRLLDSSIWSCGWETSGSSSRRQASSLPSCELRLLRTNLLHQTPTTSRGHMRKIPTQAIKEVTSQTTASKDTTRWSSYSSSYMLGSLPCTAVLSLCTTVLVSNCLLLCFLQEAEYGQGYGQQGAPTSFSNQMWTDRKKVSDKKLMWGSIWRTSGKQSLLV